MFAPINPYKTREHAEARRLRADGMPIKEIALRLDVSKGTVSKWTRDIELSAEQRALNLQLAGVRRGRACRELHRQRRLGYQEEGRERARTHDPLHLMGCMLYWAEGAKGKNQVQFVNSDPAMMRAFKRFMADCFNLPANRFSFNVNVYTNNGISIAVIERHWCDALELPRSCARKHIVNYLPTSSSGGRFNKLPYGVCSLKVTKSTRLVQHLHGAIQEYGGFEEPRWLEGY